MTLDNLTQLQKIAIEGEVAKTFSTVRHHPEVLYRLYTILKNAPQDTIPYVLECTRNLIDIKEDDINKIILEAKVEEPPIWLWVQRTVADMKLSIKFACAEGMMCEAELDKKLIQQKIVKSAYVNFCRKAALTCTKAARELCRYIIDEEPIELGFLEDVSFSMIGEISELPETEKFPDSLFHMDFDIRNMLSYRLETEVLDKREKRDKEEKELKKQSEKINEQMDKAIDEALVMPVNELHNDNMDATVYAVKVAVNESEGIMADAVSNIMKQILNDQLKTEKAMKAKETKYSVIKEYANSPVVTTLRTFDTEAEAESYKEKLEESFPELMKSCKLKVKKRN